MDNNLGPFKGPGVAEDLNDGWAVQSGDKIGQPIVRGGEDVQWFYFFEDQCLPYDKRTNERIEMAYKNNGKSIEIDKYSHIDFKQELQINNTGEKFLVLRIVDKKNNEEKKVSERKVEKPKYGEQDDDLPILPQYPPKSAKGQRIPVKEYTKEYNEVKEAFDRSMKGFYCYFEVFKLVNPRTKYFFNENLIRIAKENKKSVRETTKKLFFASATINPETIYNGYDASFDPRLVAKGSFGEGIIFTPNIGLYSGLEYTKAGEIKEVIYANVIVGNSYNILNPDPNMKYPPLLPGHPAKRYDSVSGKLLNSDVHVVYVKNMAYPEYIINFIYS